MIVENNQDQLLVFYKNQAILHANNININYLKELASLKHPPPLLFQVSNACLWILSGIYSQIQVDPITKDPVKQDWQACRKMICQHPDNLLIKMKHIFNELKDNQNSSRHLQRVRQLLASNSQLSDIGKFSLCGDYLLQWMQNVVKYEQILNQNKS